ncbi:hybrid sensor histidine kinase/response regulator [Helicobacter apodemus]|uniref:histidine kinase n=1 Tax=Helicobacter apodemus TaxID=135569 RepID=A0A2U8FBN1_9HELI|nr:chemotaxis protein CheW [Helicobacter apodemus]AWI33660.1 chemotaxis protein CheA [Helicobacter apodemus]
MDEMQEIMEDFLIEAFEMIEQLDQDLVELETRPEDLDLLNRIFRVAHTIKGSGSFLNFSVLTHLTHHMEDVLNKARHGELTITPDIMDIVLASIDFMKKLLNAIRDTGTDANTGLDSDIAVVVEKLDAISKGESLSTQPAVESPAADTIPIEEEPELDYANMSPEEIEKEIDRLLSKRQEEDKRKRQQKKAEGKGEEIQAPAEIKENAPVTPEPEIATATPVASTPAKPVATTKAPPKTTTPSQDTKAPATAVEQTIRVDVKRLDSLMNLIGELVLGKNRLIKIYNDVEERYEGEKFLEELNQVVASVSMVTTDIQLAVMKTRMLPIGRVFNKFPRMVRDLSREVGKNIELIISGEETELDKSIVEEIGDPLVHLIRNACDHGIETKEERVAAGKSEQGTVELKAYNEGNHIVVEIKDDGKGMDPEALKVKAIEKGLISEKEADTMSDKEAYSLIFKAGFSTAKVVTNISGRGVGMDVVKTNIEKLNGIIDVESAFGEGTTLKLKIPLTLAIIQSLLVGVQEEYYAIPLASVIETVRISQDEIYTVENKSVLRLRNEVLPLVRLADIFGVNAVLDNSEQAYVVVIGLAENKIGVIVDFLIGQEEVVIKSLGSYLKGTEGIAGATIRGDGRVTLIVDIAAMMQMAKQVKVSISNLIQENESKKGKSAPSDYQVLIVDDSMTDRAIMKKSLKPLGITLTEATNGVEALDIVKNGDKTFDAILIDIEMPKMDGYTLAGEIRRYAKFKNLPLIAVTSRTSKTDRMRGVESGMTEYITKPYSPEYLMNVVKRNIKFTMEVTE